MGKKSEREGERGGRDLLWVWILFYLKIYHFYLPLSWQFPVYKTLRWRWKRGLSSRAQSVGLVSVTLCCHLWASVLLLLLRRKCIFFFFVDGFWRLWCSCLPHSPLALSIYWFHGLSVCGFNIQGPLNLQVERWPLLTSLLFWFGLLRQLLFVLIIFRRKKKERSLSVKAKGLKSAKQ